MIHVVSGFRIPDSSEIVGVLGWPVPCRATDWWSRGDGRESGVVSQCGWGRFFVNDGQIVICSPNYHLLKPSSDPSLLWSGRCLLGEWRNDKAWGAIRVERILGTKHSWMQMPMGEAHGWKALKSDGCLGKVEHVLSFYSHLKKWSTTQFITQVSSFQTHGLVHPSNLSMRKLRPENCEVTSQKVPS